MEIGPSIEVEQAFDRGPNTILDAPLVASVDFAFLAESSEGASLVVGISVTEGSIDDLAVMRYLSQIAEASGIVGAVKACGVDRNLSRCAWALAGEFADLGINNLPATELHKAVLSWLNSVVGLVGPPRPRPC